MANGQLHWNTSSLKEKPATVLAIRAEMQICFAHQIFLHVCIISMQDIVYNMAVAEIRPGLSGIIIKKQQLFIRPETRIYKKNKKIEK